MGLDFPLIDIDNHYYEPDDCFSRHLDPAFADRAVNIRRGSDGLGRIYLGDRRLGYQSVTQTDFIGAPGTLRDYFRGMVEKAEGGDPDAARIGGLSDVINAHDVPAFMNRDARLALMDDQGVEAALMLPTLGVCVEYELADDVDAAVAGMCAFNRWLEDDWGYDYRGRIFAAPIIPLADLDAGLVELDRVLGNGARAVIIRVGPVAGRSPADPHFDPFWRRVVSADVPVGLHVGDSGFCELFTTQWGERPRPPVHRYTAFQQYAAFMERPIADTLAAMILQNLFGRFPSLKVISIENGSSWVAPLLKQMDKAWRATRGRDGIGGVVADRPSETFCRNVYVSPFPEDDVPGLVELIGAGRVVFGSDYPHPEGLAAPHDFVQDLPGLRPDQVRRVMRDNAAQLLGLAGETRAGTP